MALASAEKIQNGEVHDNDGRMVVVPSAGVVLEQTDVGPDGSSNGYKLVLAAVPGVQLVVTSYLLMVPGACILAWHSSNDGANRLVGPLSFAANGGVSETATPQAPLFWTETGEGLYLHLGSAVTGIGGRIVYYENEV